LCSNRGQLISADFMASTTLLVLALAVLEAAWSLGIARIGEDEAAFAAQRKADAIAEALARTPGNPADWEMEPGSPDISGIGLASSDRKLSPEKVRAMSSLGIRRLEEVFMVGGDCLTIALRGSEGSPYANLGEPNDGDYSMRSTRIVTYLNGTSVLEVTVWGACRRR
jgi:hypothetical protein